MRINLKEALYELLITLHDGIGPKAEFNQELKLEEGEISSKSGNVTIIQVGNQKVQTKVIKKVVDIMKVVDLIENKLLISGVDVSNVEVPQIEYVPSKGNELAYSSSDVSDNFLEYLYSREMGWKNMQYFICSEYLKKVLDKNDYNIGKTAKFLGMSRSYISSIYKSKYGLKNHGE